MESVCSVSKLSAKSVGSRRELVANSVHIADADATQLDTRDGTEDNLRVRPRALIAASYSDNSVGLVQCIIIQHVLQYILNICSAPFYRCIKIVQGLQVGTSGEEKLEKSSDVGVTAGLIQSVV